MTNRDLKILEFINRLGKCNVKQLSNYFMLSELRIYQILQRLKKEKLVYHQRIFHNQPGIIWCTSKGASISSSQEIIPIRNINLNSLKHDLIVNNVLINKIKQNQCLEFQTERELRQKGELDHYPDLLITTVEEKCIAIEIELTRKSTGRIEKILQFYLCNLWIDEVQYYCDHSLYSFLKRSFSNTDLIKIQTLIDHE